MNKKVLGGLLAAFFMHGCVTADISISQPGQCERFGVRNDGKTRPIRNTYELSQAEINEACKRILVPHGFYVAGCALLNKDGSIDLYWRVDDWCIEMHERAHAQCGMYHTKTFNQAVRAHHPRPTCPDDFTAP